jgi:hypothetical protein
MTTSTTAQAPANQHAFFRTTITAMAIVLVSGFVVQLAFGRSSFNAPAVVHVHAVVFMAWVAITLTQAWLGASGALAAHRTLGRAAVIFSLLLLVMGPLVTLAAVQNGRVPFFFQPQHFLVANPTTLVAFAGLFAAAIALRRQTDWHARLHVGAFAILLGPGLGRLLPMPLMTPYAFESAGLAALVAPLIGIVWDLRARGRVHPAWWWSIAALVGSLVLARLIAFSPIGDAIYATATAHTALAGSDGLAFPAPPPM